MKQLFNPAPKLEMLDYASLILRLGVGIFMLTHGIPKFEKFINGDLQFADPFGLGPEISMVLTILAEVICSVLIVIGLFTRAATLPLIITMATAALIVHDADPFNKKELGLLYLLIYFTLFIKVTRCFRKQFKIFSGNLNIYLPLTALKKRPYLS